MSDALDPTTTTAPPGDGSAPAPTTAPPASDGSGEQNDADVQALQQEIHALRSKLGQYEARDPNGAGAVSPPTTDPRGVDPFTDPETIERDRFAMEQYARTANDPMARELVRLRYGVGGLNAKVDVIATPEPIREETDKILRQGIVANAEIARELAEARMAKRTPAPPTPPLQPRPRVTALTHSAPIQAQVGGETPKMTRAEYNATMKNEEVPLAKRTELRQQKNAGNLALTD